MRATRRTTNHLMRRCFIDFILDYHTVSVAQDSRLPGSGAICRGD